MTKARRQQEKQERSKGDAGRSEGDAGRTRAKGEGAKGESWRRQWDHRVDSRMMESIGDDGESGEASEKLSLVREKVESVGATLTLSS